MAFVSEPFDKAGHASHCIRCLQGLPADFTQLDSSRVAIGFYCWGSLDILGLLNDKVKKDELEDWREWIWSLQTVSSDWTGFRPSSYMFGAKFEGNKEARNSYDLPHLVMTYTALLSLAILRDDFAKLDKRGLIQLLRCSQNEDGSFTSMAGKGESDVRMVYTAFAICHMLNDWSGVNIVNAVKYIRRCRTYEGGYGQTPFNESQGGPTYCSIASLYLLPADHPSTPHLNEFERHQTLRWLVQNQVPEGGFRGRTQKEGDACYSFWCGAALHILNAADDVNRLSNAEFLYHCQFRYGGIAKAPDNHPDPYHTYLSLASLALYPPDDAHESWILKTLDPLLNTTEETAEWIRNHVALIPVT